MKLRLTLLAAFALIVYVAAPSMADPITIDAGWYGFCFGAAGGKRTKTQELFK